MAIKTLAQLLSAINSTIYPNSNNEITAADHNALLIDIKDSYINRLDDIGLLGLKEYDLARVYALGDTVVQTGIILICTTGGATGVFNPAHWTEISAVPPETPKAFQTLVDAANISWDYSLGYNADVTLTASRILDEPTNVADGDYGTLVILQDVVGSHTLTLPASFRVVNGGAGAITLSTAANSIDSISWVKKDAKFFVTLGLNFS
jgi:hypothetical protein